jgi:hypothetical protein
MSNKDDNVPFDEDFQNTTERGTPPKHRIATAEGAKRLFEDFKDDAEPKSRQWARIQGLYDRNPPYNPDEMERQGRSGQTNVNTGEMEAAIDAQVGAANEAMFEVPTLIQVQIREPFRPQRDENNYEEIIEEEYTKTLHSWSDFFSNFDLVFKETFKFGMGYVLWPDENDWRSKAFKASTLLYPAQSKVPVDSLDIFMVRDEIPLRELFDIAQDEESAKAAGWDVPYLRDVIVESYQLSNNSSDGEEHQTSTWESVQQKIKNNDPEVERQEFKGLKVVHAGVRELDTNQVTHLIFPEDVSTTEFLFKADRRFGQMKNLIWLMTYDYGDGYLRSVKGLGHRSFMHMDLSNRLFSSIMDAGLLSSGLLVQPSTAADLSRLQLMHLGPVTVVPQGLNVIQSSFTPPINHLLPLRQMSSELVNNNLGIFRPRLENPLSRETEKTAAQVQHEASREARTEKFLATHRYNMMDGWHNETYRRMTEPEYLFAGYQNVSDAIQVYSENGFSVRAVIEASERYIPGREQALEFFFACYNRGVPADLIMNLNALDIKTSRAIGLGSISQKNQALNELMSVRDAMDTFGKRHTEREWTAARIGGYTNVGKFFPLVNRDQTPSNETSIASLENNAMMDGTQIPVGEDQGHYIHARTHLVHSVNLLQGILNQQVSKFDPVQVFRFLLLAIPHIQTHMGKMQNDPAMQTKLAELTQALQFVIQGAKKLEAQVSELQKQQERLKQDQEKEIQALQERADENAVKIETEKHRIDKEMELKAAETEALNATRFQKMQASIATKAQQTESSIAIDAAKTEAEIANEAAKTQSELENDASGA